MLRFGSAANCPLCVQNTFYICYLWHLEWKQKIEGPASRRVIEFEIVFYIGAPEWGGAGLFTINRYMWRISAGTQLKKTGNMEKCENGALLLMVLTEQGDVIRRRSTMVTCMPTGGSAAADN